MEGSLKDEKLTEIAPDHLIIPYSSDVSINI